MKKTTLKKILDFIYISFLCFLGVIFIIFPSLGAVFLLGAIVLFVRDFGNEIDKIEKRLEAIENNLKRRSIKWKR